MSAELNSVWEPLSVVWALRVLSRVTVVSRIAVFFSSEELAAADGECHISCSTIPSHQSMNSFYFPSNHSTLLSSPPHPDFSTHTHIHTVSLSCFQIWASLLCNKRLLTHTVTPNTTFTNAPSNCGPTQGASTHCFLLVCSAATVFFPWTLLWICVLHASSGLLASLTGSNHNR